jgi:hypothetical protein
MALDWGDIGEDGSYKGQPISNPCEFSGDLRRSRSRGRSELFNISLNQHEVYVWADHLEDALEAAIDWAEEMEYCDVFVTLDETDLREAADDLGITWNSAWNSAWPGQDSDFIRVRDHAETDLMLVGHASLPKCEKILGGGPLYVAHWGYTNVDDDDIEGVARASVLKCYEHPFLYGDHVTFTPDPTGDHRAAGNYLLHPRGPAARVELVPLFDTDAPFNGRVSWVNGDGGKLTLIDPEEGVSSDPEKITQQIMHASGLPYTAPAPPAAPTAAPLSERENQLVAWMMKMGWHEDTAQAIKHVYRLRASGHPWLTKGGFEGLSDEQAAAVLYSTLPARNKTFFGLKMPNYLRGRR